MIHVPIEPFVTTGGLIVVALISAFATIWAVRERKNVAAIKEQNAKLDAVLHQVKNSHNNTNLRDDIDSLRDEMHDLFALQRQALAEQRQELAEQRRRIDGLYSRVVTSREDTP